MARRGLTTGFNLSKTLSHYKKLKTYKWFTTLWYSDFAAHAHQESLLMCKNCSNDMSSASKVNSWKVSWSWNPRGWIPCWELEIKGEPEMHIPVNQRNTLKYIWQKYSKENQRNTFDKHQECRLMRVKNLSGSQRCMSKILLNQRNTVGKITEIP